jgi:Putative Ig domain
VIEARHWREPSHAGSTALELADPASQSNQPGNQGSLQVNALDCGSAATYSATGLPPGLSINSSTGVIGGTLPGTMATFPTSVTASATGVPSATQSFAWDVHGKVSLGKLGSRSGSLGSPVRYQIPAGDGLAGCTLRFAAGCRGA